MRNRVTIVAEAGVNHNGNISLAKKLIDAAANAGADYVKFQTFNTAALVSPGAEKASYQQENQKDSDTSQYNMLKKLELSAEQHRELMAYCEKRRIKFLSTAFDLDSIDFLAELNIDFFKIPSGEITNRPYLESIALKQKPVVLSTGMANMQEIMDALDVLQQFGLSKPEITVLHCNTQYPTPMEDVNLLAMNEIKRACDVKVGYSDHTLGIEVPVSAVALGAVFIEKHFTLDRSMEGPDHLASLEPEELTQMVSAIRNIELATSGNGIKEPSRSEKPNKVNARKSIHLKDHLTRGDVLKRENLLMLRPGDGISPMELNNLVGKRASRDLMEGTKLAWKDFK